MKLRLGKIRHGHAHWWRREDAGRTFVALCGNLQPREFVETKAGTFMWPLCQRCERAKEARRAVKPGGG